MPSPSDNPNPSTTPSPSPTTPTGPSTVEEAKGGEKFEDTITITDKNGEEVTIPGGFTVSPDSSDDVNGGIVIVDEQGNEFVWVPVPDPTTMYVEETVTLSRVDVTSKRYSKLRIRSGDTYVATKPGSTTGIREPDILTDTNYGDFNTKSTSRGVTQIKNVLGNRRRNRYRNIN